MALNMHLTFDGNCREAFDHYRSVFGGEFGALQTYADGPPDMPPTDGAETLVMHVSLPMGSSMLMGADRNPGMSPTLAVGNNFSIAVEARSREHCDEVFAQLSAGGKGDDAPAGHVLGRVLRELHGQVRYQLDDPLPPAGKLRGPSAAPRRRRLGRARR